MSNAVSMADPISEALARRREEVREEEASKQQLQALLKAAPDPALALELLAATWERMPEDLAAVQWKSPSASDSQDATIEILQIGTKVADVLGVYNQREEEAKP